MSAGVAHRDPHRSVRARSVRALSLCVLALSAWLLTACGDEAGDEGPLRVAAAVSLTEAMTDLVAARSAPLELRFGASSTLARQIEAGAPTDLFVSADRRWTDYLIERGFGREHGVVMRNRMAIVVPAEGAAQVQTPADLRQLAHIAIAAPDVPAGRFGREVLERQGLLGALEPHFVLAPDVRAVLAWVARGEADAGLVYVTDARVEPDVRLVYTFDDVTRDPIEVHYLVLASSGARLRAARELARDLHYAARPHFLRYGFVAPPSP